MRTDALNNAIKPRVERSRANFHSIHDSPNKKNALPIFLPVIVRDYLFIPNKTLTGSSFYTWDTLNPFIRGAHLWTVHLREMCDVIHLQSTRELYFKVNHYPDFCCSQNISSITLIMFYITFTKVKQFESKKYFGIRLHSKPIYL